MSYTEHKTKWHRENTDYTEKCVRQFLSQVGNIQKLSRFEFEHKSRQG